MVNCCWIIFQSSPLNCPFILLVHIQFFFIFFIAHFLSNSQIQHIHTLKYGWQKRKKKYKKISIDFFYVRSFSVLPNFTHFFFHSRDCLILFILWWLDEEEVLYDLVRLVKIISALISIDLSLPIMWEIYLLLLVLKILPEMRNITWNKTKYMYYIEVWLFA